MGGREIIDCDLCNAHWHLDCLDPPLAKHRKPKNKTNWTCPIHVELWMTGINVPKLFGQVPVRKATFTGQPFHDATEFLGASSLLPSPPKRAMPGKSDPGRELKIRRPKNWKPSKHSFGRGFKNNGVIAIENEPSDDEAKLEKVESGVVDRFQEKGIKLDFIDRVKQ